MQKKLIYSYFIIFLSSFCLYGQSMQWVYQSNGSVNGSCSSSSDCASNTICYGLEFTPSVSGILTSYTTGFFLDCVNRIGDGNSIVSNTSCTMATNVNAINDCGGSGIILFNSSGNSGTISISPGVPLILHQVCFNLEENETTNIEKDETTNLTLSVDLSGGGATTEFPAYSTFQASHNNVCNVLAVELSSFTATKKEDQSHLAWKTLSEINNDYFELEWSSNGRFFEKIGIIQGAGNSNAPNQYQFIHTHPVNGKNYYRIKAVEFDGSIQYSEIRSLVFNSIEKESIDIFPNPVNDRLFINLSNIHQQESYNIVIRNAAGQLISTINNATTNNNTLLTIDTDQLTPGTYLLFIESQKRHYVQKFIKTP